MKLEIQICKVGYLKTNCYIVRDTDSDKAFVVDPGYADKNLKSTLEKLGIEKLDYILLTHGHFDHILGINEVQSTFGGKTVIHEVDERFFTDSRLSLVSQGFISGNVPPFADLTVKDSDEIPFADSVIKVIHTPGHTAGSVCYLLENNLFSGDTLFRESAGRTDFPTGSSEQILMSLRKLARLEGNYRVLPGHEEETTLEWERNYNPYMK